MTSPFARSGWTTTESAGTTTTAIYTNSRGVSTVVNGRRTVRQLPADHDPREPFFVRANHGDVVELRLHNELGTIRADHFDLTQLPVECGLHVHLVKFDVLAADGSSTGWNYLSGASCREAVPGVGDVPLPANVSLHRWVVDEEFGPCFFHDHLLANYRQKRGLFAALIAEPPGASWVTGPPLVRPLSRTGNPYDEADEFDEAALGATPRGSAWTGASALVTPLPESAIGSFREACLGVGDFVPLYDREERPLNPPGDLGGDDDPGTMAVNYRCAPLTARGPNPSDWFATDAGRRGREEFPDPGEADELERSSWLRDPETPIVPTYPGERLRIRLLQGSHEEQHSFVTHGLRWRRDWQRTTSTLVNQQTLGISEAFTLDVNGDGSSPYDVADHLWRFSAMDDLWLGCWGLVRVLLPGSRLDPLPGAVLPEPLRRPRTPDRPYTVRARRIEHEYDGRRLTDPFGLVYEVVEETDSPYADPEVRQGATGSAEPMQEPWVGGDWKIGPVSAETGPEPLVVRCRPGEWIRVCLINEVRLPRDGFEARDGWTGRYEDPLLPRFGPEPHPPALPLDEERRTVSPRVSLHPALLRYDVIADDGAHVGRNRDSTVRPLPLEEDHGHGPGDDAVAEDHDHGHDRQNWRCYWWYADPELGKDIGQVCYLHDMGDIRNHRHHGLVGAIVVEPDGWEPDDWVGTQTIVRHPDGWTANEQVLFWQDGLRHYAYGDLTSPVADVEPGDDPEDAGQKGINYRCRPVHPRTQLREMPPTPTWEARQGETLWLRLVGACDKPRNHTFTVHGQQWAMGPWLGAGSPEVGGLSGLTADVVHDIAMTAEHVGDHAYRSGAFRWAVTQGMWGILRVSAVEGDARRTAAIGRVNVRSTAPLPEEAAPRFRTLVDALQEHEGVTELRTNPDRDSRLWHLVWGDARSPNDSTISLEISTADLPSMRNASVALALEKEDRRLALCPTSTMSATEALLALQTFMRDAHAQWADEPQEATETIDIDYTSSLQPLQEWLENNVASEISFVITQPNPGVDIRHLFRDVRAAMSETNSREAVLELHGSDVSLDPLLANGDSDDQALRGELASGAVHVIARDRTRPDSQTATYDSRRSPDHILMPTGPLTVDEILAHLSRILADVRDSAPA